MQKPHHVFIFYAFNGDRDKWHLRQIMEAINGATEVYLSIQSLASRLRQSLYDIIVIVLMIHDETELARILGIEALLQGLPIVIVLKSPDSELIKQCHSLHPRLVNTHKDTTTIKAVLKSIYRKHMESQCL